MDMVTSRVLGTLIQDQHKDGSLTHILTEYSSGCGLAVPEGSKRIGLGFEVLELSQENKGEYVSGVHYVTALSQEREKTGLREKGDAKLSEAQLSSPCHWVLRISPDIYEMDEQMNEYINGQAQKRQ